MDWREVTKVAQLLFECGLAGIVLNMAKWINENEVTRILSLSKRIEGDVRWSGSPGYHKFSMPVICEEAEYDITLHGVLTDRTGYLKLNVFVGPQPIVMLHVGKSHHKPDLREAFRPSP